MAGQALVGDGALGRREAVVDVAIVLAVLAAMLAAPAPTSGALAYLVTPLKMAVVLVVIAARLRARQASWASLGWAWPDSIGGVVGRVALGYLGLAVCGGLLNFLVFPQLGLAPGASVESFAALEGDTWKYLYWLAVAWTSAAIGEELVFRGFLQSRLEQVFGPGRAGVLPALLVQAAIFGFGHGYQGLSGVLLTSAAGLVLGAVRLAGRGNLVACVALHGLIDTVSLTAVYFGALTAIKAAAAAG